MDCFWIQRGDGSPEELQEYGVQNIAQYGAAQVPFPAFFSTDIHFFHTLRHVYMSVCPAREAKPRFGAALERSAHDCETEEWNELEDQVKKVLDPPERSEQHKHDLCLGL